MSPEVRTHKPEDTVVGEGSCSLRTLNFNSIHQFIIFICGCGGLPVPLTGARGGHWVSPCTTLCLEARPFVNLEFTYVSEAASQLSLAILLSPPTSTLTVQMCAGPLPDFRGALASDSSLHVSTAAVLSKHSQLPRHPSITAAVLYKGLC